MNRNQPLVSVFCPTYNHEKYIRQCLEGFVLQKTQFNFEVIVQDDASTDNTVSIIKEFSITYPFIIPIIHEVNIFSQGKDINEYFFKNAKGKYISICEGDDYWIDPLKLQKQVDFLEANEKVVACVTNSSVCDLNGFEIMSDMMVIPPHNNSGLYTLHDFLLDKHEYPTLTVVFRSDNIKDILNYMNKTSNPFLGDWLLWIFLYLYGDFYFLNSVTATYRINLNSLTHTSNAINRWKEDFIIRKKLIEILPKEYHKYLKSNFNTYFKLSLAYRKNKQKWLFVFFQFYTFMTNPILYVKIIWHIIGFK